MIVEGLRLNERAGVIVQELEHSADFMRINVHDIGGARVLDLGVEAEGGLGAGIGLARVCLAGLAGVSIAPAECAGLVLPHVEIITDHPVLACMASQYAGWQVAVDKFFAMGSGPMRAAYAGEELFQHIPGKEETRVAVGVLESRKLPGEEVIKHLCEKLALEPSALALLVAPAASQAGNVQVVARSVETALHKLYELKFDLKQIVTGWGVAPIPPVAASEIAAIGRTNDAILYAGRVVLAVRCEDDVIAEVGPKVPSSASSDHGVPFAEIFERYERDFYKIDPMLFSPAQVVFQNLKTGRTHVFGKPEPEVVRKSFGL